MRRIIIASLGVVLLVSLAIFVFYKNNFRGLKPAITPAPADIVDIIKKNKVNNEAREGALGQKKGEPVDFALNLPEGFEISIFADNLPNARVMALDALGNMWVSQPKEGKVSLLVVKDGVVVEKRDVFRNLKRPHGLAFDPQDSYVLYIAQEDKISRVRVYSEGEMGPLVRLDSGGNHWSRTIEFGPDDRLYVSIGSSCNVCNEESQQRAKIFSMKKDGSDFKEYARGLRNTVFFTWNYVDGKMWGTDMGRDKLGDDLPPDEINIIEEGKNYGWPTCYGKNIHDTNFDKNTYIRNPCMEPFEMASHIDLQAHSAPLGLAFVPEEGWPEDYWYNLLVAYHGSWDRSVPVGYKVERIKLDAEGNYLGREDFISGWLTKNNESLGRPVDIMVQPGGIMYLSDDKAGVIYKITYKGEDVGSELEKMDLIRVNYPRPNQDIESPLTITGEARGNWFFEADFPVYLYDDNGVELGFAIATAQSEWMTTKFVPFEATLEFDKPTTKTGKLILRKDNPSGLPEHDDMLYLPVRFK